MKWGRQQEEALRAVSRWLKEKDQQVFTLFGHAGAGKTTLARHLAQDAGNVLFGAYTGKAASVMRKCGCSFAQTIHQMIYIPSSKSKAKLNDLQEALMEIVGELQAEGADQDQIDDNRMVKNLRHQIDLEENHLKKPAFSLNPDSAMRHADLVVIDECSMVDERMGQDLLCFDVPILVLGDPAQLPPPMGGGYFTKRRPDVMLTEIHRQARDNPIIDLATRVRKGQRLDPGKYGASLVMRGKPDSEMVTGADQVLVGLNRTRRFVNGKVRRLLGMDQDPLPVKGDRLVCLRNDHEEGLLNGTIWKVEESTSVTGYDKMNLIVREAEGDNVVDVTAHTHYFEGRDDELRHWEMREAQSFDYGYALTTHKAQGSQWPSLFVFDESAVFRKDRNKWLYTAITRASERITICQQE